MVGWILGSTNELNIMRYLVFLHKPRVWKPIHQKPYDFEDETAARAFVRLWGGYLYEKVNGNYIKIK